MRIADKSLHGGVWPLPWLESQPLGHWARTAVAAVASLLAAYLFRPSKAY